jgi:hypothetical protein
MAVQAAAQGNRRSLVKQDPHSSDSRRGAAGGMFEHRTSLLQRDSGEKINKLSQGDSVFQVLKQSRRGSWRMAPCNVRIVAASRGSSPGSCWDGGAAA